MLGNIGHDRMKTKKIKRRENCSLSCFYNKNNIYKPDQRIRNTMLETNMGVKIATGTTTKSALLTENKVINSAPILMVSFEFIQFPLFSPLFVLFSFTHVLL